MDDQQRAIFRLEGKVATRLIESLSNDLNSRRSNLRWSDNMPDDDPDADLLVMDDDGNEYVLEVDVTLTPIETAAGVTRKAGPPPS